MRQIWNRSLWLKSKTIIGQLDTIMENLTETMDILGYTILYLVGGLEHLDYFSIYGMSSGTHWLSYFSEGLKPPTSDTITVSHDVNWNHPVCQDVLFLSLFWRMTVPVAKKTGWMWFRLATPLQEMQGRPQRPSSPVHDCQFTVFKLKPKQWRSGDVCPLFQQMNNGQDCQIFPGSARVASHIFPVLPLRKWYLFLARAG